MKKFIFMLVLLCAICVGCGKNGSKGDDAPGDISLPEAAYKYSYEEAEDGTVEFSIKGTWDEGFSWQVVSQETGTIEVEENSSEKKAEYVLKTTDTQDGYGQLDFVLSNEETNESIYTITLLLAVQEEKLMVVDVFYSDSTEVEETEEETEEVEEVVEDEEEEEVQETIEVSLPTEIEVEETRQTVWEGRTDETVMTEVLFAYKEKAYRLYVSDDISLSEFQKAKELQGLDMTKEVLNGVEVYTFFERDNSCTMWRGTDGLRNYMYAEGIKHEDIMETVGLFLK